MKFMNHAKLRSILIDHSYKIFYIYLFFQWNLVCETEELAELTQALLTVGMMLGSLVGPSRSGFW